MLSILIDIDIDKMQNSCTCRLWENGPDYKHCHLGPESSMASIIKEGSS